MNFPRLVLLAGAFGLLSACGQDGALQVKLPAKTEKKDQPEQANAFFIEKRLPPGEQRLDYARYFQARAQAAKLPVLHTTGTGAGGHSSFSGWEFLGPGNVGGRTRQIVIDPNAPDTLYAASVAGGIWKSTDAGASWVPLDDLLPNLAISSLVMDPADSNVLYAGTGEGYFNIDAVRGAGILKTTDAGASWQLLAATSNDPAFYYVNDLEISTLNSQRVYAATNSGLFRSDDGGASWNAILATSADGNYTRLGRCTQLALRTDTASNDTLFASCLTSFNDGATSHAGHMVWRSSDANAAQPVWEVVLDDPGMGRTSLALAPSDQDVIYALSAHDGTGNADYTHGLHAVFRSADGGTTWVKQTDYTNANAINTTQLSNPPYLVCNTPPQFYNQGWYDNVIAVDPVNPDRVWTGGIDLMISDDGGQNWGIASYWYLNPSDYGVNSDSPHADQHAIVFHPDYDGINNTQVYVGNDGGVYRANGGNSAPGTAQNNVCVSALGDIQWIGSFNWENLNNGYGVTQFYNGQAYPDGSTYFAGAQDNGTQRGNDTDGPNNWQEIRGGDGGYVSVNPDDTNIIYSSYTQLSLNRWDPVAGAWVDATNGIDRSLDAGFLFITPHTMDNSNPNILWIGGSYLWRTDDGGDNWVQASTDNGGRLSAVATAATDSNRVLAGFTDGEIRINHNALAADATTDWTAVVLQNGCYVSSLRFDPTDASNNIAYATSSTFTCPHVWKTSDGGLSWTNINANLPDIPAHDLLVDPQDSQHLLLATDLGMFVSMNGGASWAQENTGFANVVVESLDMEMVNGVPVLYAFTHGRGAWRAQLAAAPGNDLIFKDSFETQ